MVLWLMSGLRPCGGVVPHRALSYGCQLDVDVSACPPLVPEGTSWLCGSRRILMSPRLVFLICAVGIG